MPVNFDASQFDDAEKAQAPAKVYFGFLELDMYKCALVKGEGKVLFDANKHKPGDRKQAINFVLHALPSGAGRDPIKREMIAESDEYTKIVRPSYQALKLDLRQLVDRYVQVEMVPTRTYKNKDGETKQATTFKFLAVFDTVEKAEEAAEAFFGRTPSTDDTTTASGPAVSNGASSQSAQPPGDTANLDDPRRKTAVRFLGGFLKNVKDIDELMTKLSKPIAGWQFDPSDPEVLAVPEVKALLASA